MQACWQSSKYIPEHIHSINNTLKGYEVPPFTDEIVSVIVLWCNNRYVGTISSIHTVWESLDVGNNSVSAAAQTCKQLYCLLQKDVQYLCTLHL